MHGFVNEYSWTGARGLRALASLRRPKQRPLLQPVMRELNGIANIDQAGGRQAD